VNTIHFPNLGDRWSKVTLAKTYQFFSIILIDLVVKFNIFRIFILLLIFINEFFGLIKYLFFGNKQKKLLNLLRYLDNSLYLREVSLPFVDKNISKTLIHR